VKVTVNGRRVEDMAPAERAAWEARAARRGAEMLAAGAPPLLRSDNTYLAIADNANGKQFEGQPAVGDYYRKKAERAGVSTTGKTYLSALAAFPGDPRAWVSDRGDIKKVCEERGWGCDGAVKVKGRQFEHKPVGLAEDIVKAEVEKALEKEPGAKPAEVREKVVRRRKPHWAK
jgi:hypothetical protein